MPVRSFFSSRSFWRFSIFIMIPWSCSTISEISAKAAGGEKFIFIFRGGKREESHKKGHVCTSAVPEVIMGGWIMLTEPLQDEFIVQQAVERPEEEDVEGQVANPLLLEVSTQSLHLSTGPEDNRDKQAFALGYSAAVWTTCLHAHDLSTHRQARSSSTRHSECFWR